MQRGSLLLALLLCSCGPGLPKATVTPPPGIEAEEYAVYSALVRQNPIGYDLGSSLVVRENTRADLDMFERTLENVHKLPASLVESYRSRNAASYTLSPNLDIEQDYVLMPQEEAGLIPNSPPWPTIWGPWSMPSSRAARHATLALARQISLPTSGVCRGLHPATWGPTSMDSSTH